jgi:hypothetical protein
MIVRVNVGDMNVVGEMSASSGRFCDIEEVVVVEKVLQRARMDQQRRFALGRIGSLQELPVQVEIDNERVGITRPK